MMIILLDMVSITICVDGACRSNNDEVISSIGLAWGEKDKRNCGLRVRCFSNNQAELAAAYAAIKMAIEQNYYEVVIETDSQYVQGIFSKWIVIWKKNGWRTSKRKTVKNQRIIKAIDDLGKSIKTSFIWRRGHVSENVGNKVAHDLATQALEDPNAKYLEIDENLFY